MNKLCATKTGSEKSTFIQLSAGGYKDLKVYATDLNKSTIQEFSNEKTPDVIVAEACRASMSIPLFFSAWKFPSGSYRPTTYLSTEERCSTIRFMLLEIPNTLWDSSFTTTS